CVGVSVMVGQNLGAGKPERATAAAKYAIIINAAFMFLLGLAYFIFATPLLTVFGATGEWLAFGEQFMHIVPWSYAVIAAGMTMGFAMNGAGATRPGMYAALVGMIGVQVGGSLLCVTVLGLGVSSIWFCIFISAFFTTGIDALFFLWGKWKKQKLHIDA
ncbi:MAG TPA: MATE family efflux transporter, partial [Methanocorpusculum sp.]|nr:MATE family efflux transporter [Methanocorpusculum sp.]